MSARDQTIFRKLFKREMHTNVVTNIKRVGLLNERTSGFLRDIGIDRRSVTPRHNRLSLLEVSSFLPPFQNGKRGRSAPGEVGEVASELREQAGEGPQIACVLARGHGFRSAVLMTASQVLFSFRPERGCLFPDVIGGKLAPAHVILKRAKRG